MVLWCGQERDEEGGRETESEGEMWSSDLRCAFLQGSYYCNTFEVRAEVAVLMRRAPDGWQRWA
jgi:hypothetical protein